MIADMGTAHAVLMAHPSRGLGTLQAAQCCQEDTSCSPSATPNASQSQAFAPCFACPVTPFCSDKQQQHLCRALNPSFTWSCAFSHFAGESMGHHSNALWPPASTQMVTCRSGCQGETCQKYPSKSWPRDKQAWELAGAARKRGHSEAVHRGVLI